MIPKKIHFCWFGRGEKSKLTQKCIDSWHKFCPDYEIIEWNEDNFDVNMNGYTKMCYQEKKYAFLSDYARLLIVAQNGGLYFDTDVELIKSPDNLLHNEAFFGYENPEYVATGLGFGSVAHGTAVEAMLAEYDPFLDGTNGTEGCPGLNTKALVRLGLVPDGTKKSIEGAVIYPPSVMNPLDSATGKLEKTEETVSIHWYAATWMSKKQKVRRLISTPLHRVFGVDAFARLRK